MGKETYDQWRKLRISCGSETRPLPDWAHAYLSLGTWVHSFQEQNKRLIVFVVLPTRRLAGAFASLGSLAAGANNFRPSITWPKFRSLPPSTAVHWKDTRDGKRFSGTIEAFCEEFGTEFIRIDYTKPTSWAKAGVSFIVSRETFEDYSFSLAPKPSNMQAIELVEVTTFLRTITSQVDPAWVNADATECLLITNRATLEADVSGTTLNIEQSPYPLEKLLLLGAASSNNSKLLVSSPMRADEFESPVAILDGPRAFEMHSQLRGNPNLLIFLEKSEYNESIENSILMLKHASAKNQNLCQLPPPAMFPLGFDVAAFISDTN